MSAVVDKFIKYVKVDTESDENSETTPSTAKQFDLANILVEELRTMGASDVSLDENGYIMATIESNCAADLPTIGFIAHMDTSPDFSGKDVKPRIVENYDGGDIILNDELGIVLKVDEFPNVAKYKGDRLIVTDGTTLLGADDKAGIAEIMTMAEILLGNPDIPHGRIRIGFTPDEEVGRGADKFDVEKFGADFAYTVDGGELGEMAHENFNAASAKVTIKGVSIHPGNAKGKMRNAILVGQEFNDMLPKFEIPGYTEGREGFYHLREFEGNVTEAKMAYIIRDHDMSEFEHKKALIVKVAKFLNSKYGEGTVEIEVTDSYFNMQEKIHPVMHVVETAMEAMRLEGIEPIDKAVRGGTDGARLSFMGLPTPNLFTGGENYHGKYEFISIESMEKSVAVLLRIIQLYSETER